MYIDMALCYCFVYFIILYLSQASVSDCTDWYKMLSSIVLVLVWEVDELQADHSTISACGVTTTDSGTVQSTLTVLPPSNISEQ